MHYYIALHACNITEVAIVNMWGPEVNHIITFAMFGMLHTYTSCLLFPDPFFKYKRKTIQSGRVNWYYIKQAAGVIRIYVHRKLPLGNTFSKKFCPTRHIYLGKCPNGWEYLGKCVPLSIWCSCTYQWQITVRVFHTSIGLYLLIYIAITLGWILTGSDHFDI